jgi:hypothetical protein
MSNNVRLTATEVLNVLQEHIMQNINHEAFMPLVIYSEVGMIGRGNTLCHV